MSEQTASADNTAKNAALPQFMNENNIADYEVDEKQSWLANNLHRLMICVSIVWFAIVLIYITQFFGWSNLFLMMPDEFGAFLAGITLPLAIIWVVIAYIDRGTSFNKEAKFLRAYMNQLVYPEQGAPETAKAMADAIRSQVVELQQITKMATEQTAKIKVEIGANINEFAKLVSTLDTYSSHTIVELSDSVKFLVKNFENISSKAENSAQTIAQFNREFVANSDIVEKNIGGLIERLLPRVKEIKDTADILHAIAENSNNDILRANEMLLQFNNQSRDNLNHVNETISNQAAVLQKISEKAMGNCAVIQKNVNSEITNLDSLLNSHIARIDAAVNEYDGSLQKRLTAITNQAQSGCEQINETILKGLDNVDAGIAAQVSKIDEAMGRYTKDWQDNVQQLDEFTDTITSKLNNHSAGVAQEIDKVKVRSNNLAESVAMQVDELSQVADSVVSSLQRVDAALQNNIDSLHEKSELANDNISSFAENLEDKAKRLSDISVDVFAKSSQAADELTSRHEAVSQIIADAKAQIEELNDELFKASDNVRNQAESSIKQMNEAGDNMNKYSTALSEASSIVVSQSQISEAALSQQQRNITNSANRVEEIKLELKRQIDELSKASATLEQDAGTAVNKFKHQLSEMLSSCEDVVAKAQNINDNLEEQSTKFDTSTNRTLTKITQFENILSSQSQNMDELSKAITERANAVNNALTRQAQEIDRATGNSNNIFEQLTSSFETQNSVLRNVAENTVSYVSDVVQSLDDKAAALGFLFKQQENEFFGLCDKLSENTVSMSEALKKQIAIIDQNADKVFARMTSLEEDAAKHSEAVVNNSNRSIDKLAEMETLLGQKNTFVRDLVTSVANDFSAIADNIQAKVDLFGSTVKNIREESSNSADIILGSCGKLQTANSDLSSETKNLNKMMDDQLKNMDVSLVKAKLQADDIKQMLEHQRDSLTDAVNTLSAQTRLGEASLAQQYKYLTDAATDVAQKIKEINDNFKSNTDNIFDTTTKIAYEFDVLGDRLIKAGEDVQKTTKNSIKNIEQVNMSLSQCSEDLDATIHHSSDNIGGVFKEYEKYLAGFNTVTAETSTGVIEINNLISEQSDKMVKISDDTKKLVDCFNTVLNETSSALSDRANIAYDKVKGLGENLKNLGLQLEEATKISAAHFENSGDKLRATMGEISANAERISNEIRTSGEVFIKQSGVLVAATEDTVSKVHGAMTELVESTKEFDKRGDNIVKQSLHFNEVVAAQIKELNDHTQKADTTLQNLQQAYQGIQIDSFLKNASGIIERMETISVDINRVFNPKDEEDLWKKFYNGDTSVFVRYLSRNMTKQQINAIRSEYEKNHDFRLLVSNYLSEFETLVERAKASEHSGVLLSVISGADIGKLYYILAKTLDKLN